MKRPLTVFPGIRRFYQPSLTLYPHLIRGFGAMAISVFCPVCKRNCALEAEACKCGNVFGRSKQYRVTVYQDGRPVYNKVLPNLTLARQTEDIEKAKVHKGEAGITGKRKPAPTLNEVWTKYLPAAKVNKPVTWDDDLFNYRKHLEPRFGKKRLDAISAMDVNRLKLEMAKGQTKDGAPCLSKRGKPYSAATIKHQLILLKHLYRFAQESRDFKYTGDTPFVHKQVIMPHLDNEFPRYLTDDHLEALYSALEKWPEKVTVGFIKFALLTGVRRGTLFPLKWEHVDFDRGLVTLTISHRRKGTETVTETVCPEAMDVLRGLPRTSEYVFPGKGGGQRTDFKGPWRRIRKAAGLPDTVRFHDLRHTFGSYHAMNGTPLQVLQALMHHRDFRTTLKYGKVAPGVIKDTAVQSGKLLIPKARAEVVNIKE